MKRANLLQPWQVYRCEPLTLMIALDVDGAPAVKIDVVPTRVRRDVVPAGIRYTVVVLNADIPNDPAIIRSIQIDDREDGHATEMRMAGLAWTEIEFVCQETRPMLDDMAARPA